MYWKRFEEVIDQDQEITIKAFREFIKQANEDECLENDIKNRRTDSEIKTEIEKWMNGKPIGKLNGMEKAYEMRY